MRKHEFLFKALHRKKGEKVYMNGRPVSAKSVKGGVLYGKGDHSIIYMINEDGHFEDKYPVYTDTICQFIGARDQDNKEVYEYDLLLGHLDDEYPDDESYATIVWNGIGYSLCERSWQPDKNPPIFSALDPKDIEFIRKHYRVVGNMFEDPEKFDEYLPGVRKYLEEEEP